MKITQMNDKVIITYINLKKRSRVHIPIELAFQKKKKNNDKKKREGKVSLH